MSIADSISHLIITRMGDLTPLDDVSKEEKTRREGAAIDYFVHDLLGSSPAALRIEALWHEYEDRQTKESRLVKDLDRFELCLQAVEYERCEWMFAGVVGWIWGGGGVGLRERSRWDWLAELTVRLRSSV